MNGRFISWKTYQNRMITESAPIILGEPPEANLDNYRVQVLLMHMIHRLFFDMVSIYLVDFDLGPFELAVFSSSHVQ